MPVFTFLGTNLCQICPPETGPRNFQFHIFALCSSPSQFFLKSSSPSQFFFKSSSLHPHNSFKCAKTQKLGLSSALRSSPSQFFLVCKHLNLGQAFQNSSTNSVKKSSLKKSEPPPCKTLNVALLNWQKLHQKRSPKRSKKQARNKHKTALVLLSLTANCCCGYGLLRTIASLLLLAEFLLHAPGPLAPTSDCERLSCSRPNRRAHAVFRLKVQIRKHTLQR